MAQVDFVAFGVIIDDIVFPDGRTAMGVLGGGGTQTAFGMRLWAETVGLAAGAGQDELGLVLPWLEACEIDTGGLRISGLPTLRAWQLMEEDGRRTQIWRVPESVVAAQIGRSLDYLPENYRHAKGYHFGIHPDEPDLDFIAGLRRLGGLVSIEPFKPAEHKPASSALNELLSLVDIFSANQLEAASLVGEGRPFELAQRLVEAGARLAVIRLGEQGSLAIDSTTVCSVRLPALPVQVVDPVGAGNAYCGAFLAGYAQTGDLRQAAAYGAVAASFLVEQVGIPTCTPAQPAESRRRLAALLPQVIKIT